MDAVRFGLLLRALRRRRRWTQQRLADEVGVSRSAIARIEQGRGDRLTVRTLLQVASALGARVQVRLLWHGEALDRLLDERHARLVDRTLEILAQSQWETATEVSFNFYGDRGSVDILAYHRPSGSLLVIEIKSVVPDLQGMLGRLDLKARVAAELARERGWIVRSVSRLLVLPDDRTARRRIDDHRATFASALPERTVAVRRWLAQPSGTLAGIVFLSDDTQAVGRHRITARTPDARREPRTR